MAKRLVFDQETLSYATTLVGGGAETLTLTVTATQDVSNFSATLHETDAAQFTLTGEHSGLQLDAGQTCTISILYSPSEVGSHNAAVYLRRSGRQAGAVAECALSGTAVQSDPATIDGDATSLALGSTTTHTSVTSSIDVLTVANGDTYTLTPSLATGAVFSSSVASATTVSGGTTLPLTITFTPTAGEAYTDTLTIGWERSGSLSESGTLSVELSGTGVEPAVSVSPASLDYGSLELNETSSLDTTVEAVTDITMTATLGGDDAGQFSLDASYTSITLSAGATQTVSATYQPTEVGSHSATIFVHDSEGVERGTCELTGEGLEVTPEITVVPTSLAFANNLVGSTSVAQSVVVTADTDITMTATLGGTDPGEFSMLADHTGVGLTEGQTRTVWVVHTPTTAVAHTASISFEDSDGVERGTCDVTGTGVAIDEPIVSTDALDLGTLFVGNDMTGSVTVSSAANGDTYAYTPVLTTGTIFTCDVTTTTSLDGGVSLVLTITFTPTAEASYSDTLTIAWVRSGTYAASGTLTVNLTGIGVVTSDVTDDDSTDTEVTGTGVDTTNSRATISVPTHDSFINLGAAYEDATVDGFWVSTTRNIYLKAAKSATVQSNGNAVFSSSASDACVIAGNDFYLVGGEDAYLGGGESLGLMAGFGSGIDASTNFSDGDPTTPSGLDGLDSGFEAADITNLTVTILVSVAGIAKAYWTAKYLTDVSAVALKLPVGIIHAANTTAFMAAYKAYDICASSAALANDVPSKRLSVFGAAGVLGGTPSFCAISGATTVTVTGLNTTTMGLVNATLEGVWSATVDSWGDTVVMAGKNISSVTCWQNAVAARAGTLLLEGANVTIGNKGKVLSYSLWPPAACEAIHMNANSGGITVKATDSSKGKVTMQAKETIDLLVDETKKLEITSDDSVTILCGKLGIKCTKDKIEVLDPDGEVMLELASGSIKIGSGSGLLDMTSSGGDLCGGKVAVDAMGVTWDASSVEIL